MEPKQYRVLLACHTDPLAPPGPGEDLRVIAAEHVQVQLEMLSTDAPEDLAAWVLSVAELRPMVAESPLRQVSCPQCGASMDDGGADEDADGYPTRLWLCPRLRCPVTHLTLGYLPGVIDDEDVDKEQGDDDGDSA